MPYFPNLGLLFAVGVGVGLARENHGAAGLAALVGLSRAPRARVGDHAARDAVRDSASCQAQHAGRPAVRASSPGVAYNRFSNIKLPSYLGFFGGRRFVPDRQRPRGAWCWPRCRLRLALHRARHGCRQPAPCSAPGPVGLFAYGVLNRLLIVTGLHHILNNFAWFILGDYHGATGDLKRFFAGDPSAGAFMSGFFPVMMFGLPGACLAMYHAARPERRAAVGGLLLSLGLTSFLTGVTEPIEFTFMFLAPVLYALHAVADRAGHGDHGRLAACAWASVSRPDCSTTCSISATRQRPLLLLPIGAAYFGALLRRVPLLHRALQPGDARPRTRGWRAAGRQSSPARRAAAASSPRWAAPPISRKSPPAPRGFGWCSSTIRRSTRRRCKQLGARGVAATRHTGAAGGAGTHRRSGRGRDSRCAARQAARTPSDRSRRRAPRDALPRPLLGRALGGTAATSAARRAPVSRPLAGRSRQAPSRDRRCRRYGAARHPRRRGRRRRLDAVCLSGASRASRRARHVAAKAAMTDTATLYNHAAAMPRAGSAEPRLPPHIRRISDRRRRHGRAG